MKPKFGKGTILMVAALSLLSAAGALSQTLLNPGFETWSGSVTADNWTQYTTVSGVTCMKRILVHGFAACVAAKRFGVPAR